MNSEIYETAVRFEKYQMSGGRITQSGFSITSNLSNIDKADRPSEIIEWNWNKKRFLQS